MLFFTLRHVIRYALYSRHATMPFSRYDTPCLMAALMPYCHCFHALPRYLPPLPLMLDMLRARADADAITMFIAAAAAYACHLPPCRSYCCCHDYLLMMPRYMMMLMLERLPASTCACHFIIFHYVYHAAPPCFRRATYYASDARYATICTKPRISLSCSILINSARVAMF